MHLILIGMPGAGKSTLAKRLSEHIGLPVTDTDWEVEKRAGMPIPELFAAEGEAAFRALEAEVLTDALADSPQIIATGGGLPVQPGAIEALLGAGLVVYLLVDEATALARLAAEGGTRPLLGDAPEKTWPALLEERKKTYLMAHIVCRDGDVLAEAVCGMAHLMAGNALV